MFDLPSSMTQTSGSLPDSSTGIFATRSIHSWMALVIWGTLFQSAKDSKTNSMHLHLDRLSEVVSSAFPLDDGLVDLAGCDVVLSGQRGQEIPLVVAKVEVHLPSVSG